MEWNTVYSNYNIELLPVDVKNNFRLVCENKDFVIESKSYTWDLTQLVERCYCCQGI